MVPVQVPEQPSGLFHVPDPTLEPKCPAKLYVVPPDPTVPLAAPPRDTCPLILLPDMVPSLVISSVQLQSGMQEPVLTPFHAPLAAEGPGCARAGALLLCLGGTFFAARGLALSSCPPETDLSCLPMFPPVLPA